ncbi:hypothetical protein [Suttonella ornithocola]|uniref:Uncharacterized protein n=1 Tax=Suttonella ornithocola TaxID=279832 RepID=A0A380RAD1_9GAMM|nr:hypothetical protein [Suttonella ornithocola]SUQ09730.1 Uncharacterised protein [Suttonella ornithocola]
MWFKAFAHRAYGYSTKGQVCHGSDNWHLKNQSNAIGAIINGELFALRLYDGSIVKSLRIQSIQSRYKEQLVVELSKTN